MSNLFELPEIVTLSGQVLSVTNPLDPEQPGNNGCCGGSGTSNGCCGGSGFAVDLESGD